MYPGMYPSYKSIRQHNACKVCQAPIIDYIEKIGDSNTEILDRIEICARGHTTKFVFYKNMLLEWDFED